MATKKMGVLDGMDHISMQTARRIHRRLVKTRKVRRSFKRWFRVEARGFCPDTMSDKAWEIMKATPNVA